MAALAGLLTPMRVVVALALFGVAVVLWRVAAGDAPAPAAPDGAVGARAATLDLAARDVVIAGQRALSRRLPLSGTLHPLVQSQVVARVSGEVLELTRREGEAVAAGEVLARIDTRAQEALVASRRAELARARAQLGIAALELEQTARLRAKNVIAQHVLDTARATHDAATAEVELATAQLRLATIGLEDAVVRAPIAGVVARRFVEPGEKVAIDTPLLALVDLSRLELRAAAPAAELPVIAVGQGARVRVDGFGERVFEARVERINPVTEQGSRQVMLYLALGNADGALRGGMFAEGELVIERSAPVVAVPAAALHHEAGEDFAWVVEAGALVRRRLELGAARGDDGAVEVRAGLQAGAVLLAVPLEALQEGTPVRLAATPDAGSPAGGAGPANAR